jgi:nicotinamidase-related amidase
MTDRVDPRYINVDPLRETYRELIVDASERRTHLKHGRTALLCVDMQYLDAVPGHGVFADAENSGIPVEAQGYYFNRLQTIVFPNVKLLQDHFRHRGLEVIHVRIQSLTQDGRDRSMGHKKLNLLARPGSKEAEFVEEVAPKADEIVINKTSSGVFASTNMHYILGNLDINALWVVGVYTDECVSTTVRDASDLGYLVTLIDDGCATVTEERHRFTMETLRDRYTRILTTEQAVHEIEEHVEPDAASGTPA